MPVSIYATTPWNDSRLAPSAALLHGYGLYYLPGDGPMLGHIYGPVAPLAYLPALAWSTPTAAIRAGVGLTLLCLTLPAALMCRDFAANRMTGRRRCRAPRVSFLPVRRRSCGGIWDPCGRTRSSARKLRLLLFDRYETALQDRVAGRLGSGRGAVGRLEAGRPAGAVRASGVCLASRRTAGGDSLRRLDRSLWHCRERSRRGARRHSSDALPDTGHSIWAWMAIRGRIQGTLPDTP